MDGFESLRVENTYITQKKVPEDFRDILNI